MVRYVRFHPKEYEYSSPCMCVDRQTRDRRPGPTGPSTCEAGPHASRQLRRARPAHQIYLKMCLPVVLGAVLAIGFSTKPIFAALQKFCGLLSGMFSGFGGGAADSAGTTFLSS